MPCTLNIEGHTEEHATKREARASVRAHLQKCADEADTAGAGHVAAEIAEYLDSDALEAGGDDSAMLAGIAWTIIGDDAPIIDVAGKVDAIRRAQWATPDDGEALDATQSVRTEDPAPYHAAPVPDFEAIGRAQDRRATITRALEYLRIDMHASPVLDDPRKVAEYLTVHAGARADQHREFFGVLFLDAQHRLIAYEGEMFAGTLMQTSVYPREIARRALMHNAAAVILTHNHPSGEARPSRADEALTQTLKASLALIDVRVLDHLIVAGAQCQSMAALGLA